jgi:hypothetical protein
MNRMNKPKKVNDKKLQNSEVIAQHEGAECDSDLKLLWCTSADCKKEGEIKTGACKCDSV